MSIVPPDAPTLHPSNPLNSPPSSSFSELISKYGLPSERAYYASNGVTNDPKFTLPILVGTLAQRWGVTHVREAFAARSTTSTDPIQPPSNLVPILPGRMDYIVHCVQTLLPPPPGAPLSIIDVGSGPIAVYALLGALHFSNATFTCLEIDPTSLARSRAFLAQNDHLLGGRVVVNQGEDGTSVSGLRVLNPLLNIEKTSFDLVVCNPPFHSSSEDPANNSQPPVPYQKITKRPRDDGLPTTQTTSSESFTDGGEAGFLLNKLIPDSLTLLSPEYPPKVTWFTCLLSRKSSVRAWKTAMESLRVVRTRVLELGGGGRGVTRSIVCWSFADVEGGEYKFAVDGVESEEALRRVEEFLTTKGWGGRGECNEMGVAFSVIDGVLRVTLTPTHRLLEGAARFAELKGSSGIEGEIRRDNRRWRRKFRKAEVDAMCD